MGNAVIKREKEKKEEKITGYHPRSSPLFSLNLFSRDNDNLRADVKTRMF